MWRCVTLRLVVYSATQFNRGNIMASFFTVVSLIQRDATTCTSELVDAFGADLLVFLTSNNRTNLDRGITALDKTSFGKKVKDVLKGLTIPQAGYSGALTGAFKAQSEDTQKVWLDQHATIVAAFKAGLESAGLFEKKTLSEADKAERKAKADAKKTSELQTAIDQHIKANSLVPSTQVLGQSELVDLVVNLIQSGMMLPENLTILTAALVPAPAPAPAPAH